MAAVHALLQLEQEAALAVVLGRGLVAARAVAAHVAAVVHRVPVAQAGLHQPESVFMDLAGQRRVGAPAAVGGVVVGLGQRAEALAILQQVGRIERAQVGDAGDRARAAAAAASVGAAHDVQARQAVEVHRLQSALHAARAIVQPGQADAVHAGQHAVLVQATDIDAVGQAIEIDARLDAPAEVAPVAHLQFVQALAVGAALPSGRGRLPSPSTRTGSRFVTPACGTST